MYKGEEREARMSFAKASVKRFNEDHNDAPAPNAYDAKMPAKKDNVNNACQKVYNVCL